MNTISHLRYVTVHPSRQMHDGECSQPAIGSAGERHYRVTRPHVYRSPGCPGHQDVSARCGHYEDACCATHAARRIQARLLDEVRGILEEPLDVQVWR